MTGSPTATTVLARHAPHVPVRRAWLRENVLNSLWFLPLASVVGIFAVARVTLEVDESSYRLVPPKVLFPGGAVTVASMSGTIAAAMLTFLAIVFSTTLVAVQLASTQYSPRIVRVFVRSRITQVTLALFMATFVVALEVLVSTGGGGRSDPALTALFLYVLTLATVVVFVVFMHRIVRLLRVQYLLLLVSRDARTVIELEFPEEAAYHRASLPESAPSHALEYPGAPGVIQGIDLGGLCALAARHGAWIELRVRPGEQVGRHTRMATVHHDTAQRITAEAIAGYLLVGGERTLIQDPAFGVRQLVDTASRALSPAVNDPTTAAQALHRITDLLLRIADRPDPTGWYTDDAGIVRLHVPTCDFEHLGTLGVTEVLRYGADAPQITRTLLAACDDMDAAAPQRAELVARFRARIERAVTDACPDAFRDIALRPDRLGLG